MKLRDDGVVFVVTHVTTGYNLNSAKDYQIYVFDDMPPAMKLFKKNFKKFLAKTKLGEKRKEEIIEQFNKDLKQGKFVYHFRDVMDTEFEPQYFGKIHKRKILDK